MTPHCARAGAGTVIAAPSRIAATTRREGVMVSRVGCPRGMCQAQILRLEPADQGPEIALHRRCLAAEGEEAGHPVLRRASRERAVEAVGLLEEALERRRLRGDDGLFRERDRLGGKR